jgi:hypothetical protein
MKTRHLRAVLALLAAPLAVPLSAGASQAATASPPALQGGPGAAPAGRIGIRLLQAPGSQASNPRDSLYIVEHLPPGSVIQRKFQVVNQGTGPVRLLVYPAAATIARGSMQFAAGHTQDEMTTWIRISQPVVNLAAHSAATLAATIAVPRGSPPGEQYGVIWAEQDTRGPGNILLVSRVGIRLYLSVGSGNAPASGFTLGHPATSRTPGGNPVITLPVHNTGGLALDVRGTLQLADGPGGVQAGPFSAASVITLAPGQSHPDRFVLSTDLPAGPWRARFTMASELLTRTETAFVTFPALAAPAAHTTFPAVPVAAGAGATVLLAAALLITRARRRRGPGQAST